MMHGGRDPGTTRTARPCVTPVVLLGVGAITLGAAAMLLPSTTKTPHPATPEVERIATPTNAGATTGGVEATPATENVGTVEGESIAIATSPSASAPTIGSVAVAPPASSAASSAASSVIARTTIATAPAAATNATESVSANASAVGGGPPSSDLSSDAGVATSGDAGVELGDGSATAYSPNSIAAPVYASPSAATSSTSGSSPTSNIAMGIGGGSAAVNTRPSIATSFLLTMIDTDDPEHAWTALTPYLRPSDVVMAHLAGAGANDVAYMDWGDRVRTDTPLVQYLVTVDDASKLKDLVSRGLPMNVGGIGVARTDALDAATLNVLSTAVRAVGRRFFVSASTASPVALSQIGARADVIELVLSSSDPTASISEASNATSQLRSGGAPTVFVRLPSGATSSTSATTFLTSLASAAPSVGVSIPYDAGTGFLGDLRSSP
jgi:hypothetical protein